MKQHKKILFLYRNDDGSTYYRMRLPAEKLKQLGFDCSISGNFNDELMLVKIDDEAVSLYEFDIVFFQAITLSWVLPMLEKMRKAHITLVTNIDDDYFNSSGYGAFLMSKEQIDAIRKSLEIVDNVLVSTPELAQLYGIHRSKVIENYIDISLYNTKKIQHDKFTVGWFGTVNHLFDLELLNHALPDDIRLVTAGFPEVTIKYFDNVKDQKALSIFPISQLPSIISEIDLGLVPLLNNKFNQGKSDLKGVEFGAGHVPVIASKVAPYIRWVEQGYNGFLADNSKDFIKFINRIRNNPDLLNELSINAREKALTRDINTGIKEYIDFYNFVI